MTEWLAGAYGRVMARTEWQDECLVFLGYRNPKGYGTVNTPMGVKLAHRVVSEFIDGPIAGPRVYVCHSCDNPPCVNPHHLWRGTAAENSADMSAKNRATRISGERSPRSKLTDAQADEIRAIYALGGITQIEIGHRFGIHQAHVSRICTGRRRPIHNNPKWATEHGYLKSAPPVETVPMWDES